LSSGVPITPPKFSSEGWHNVKQELGIKPRSDRGIGIQIQVIPKLEVNFEGSKKLAGVNGGRMPKAADILSSSNADFRKLMLTLGEGKDLRQAFLADEYGSLSGEQVKEFAEELTERIKTEVPELNPHVGVDGVDGGHLGLAVQDGVDNSRETYVIACLSDDDRAHMVLSMKALQEGAHQTRVRQWP
jgi:hypothetical protein